MLTTRTRENTAGRKIDGRSIDFQKLASGDRPRRGGIAHPEPVQHAAACVACSGDGFDMSGSRCYRCGGTRIEPDDTRAVRGRRI